MSTDFAGLETKQANRRRKIIPPATELAARIRDEGVTVADLAAEFEVSKSKVARDLNDAGFRGNGQPTFSHRPPSTENARLPHISHRYTRDDESLLGALCASKSYDPEFWYPANAKERATCGELAKQICADCPVAVACLTRALEEEATDGLRFGIRGGLDEDERAALVDGAVA